MQPTVNHEPIVALEGEVVLVLDRQVQAAPQALKAAVVAQSPAVAAVQRSELAPGPSRLDVLINHQLKHCEWAAIAQVETPACSAILVVLLLIASLGSKQC
eukprot:91057_1